MTDREALYRATLANPDDDTLRLIYADALEEEGDGRRAAFIRSQVQLASLPEYDPARVRARYLDRDQLDDNLISELPELPPDLHWDREPFRRGLPAAIQAQNAAAFVRGADEVFSHFPVESLELEVAQLADAREFAQCLWLSRIVRLSVSLGLSGPSARWFLDSPNYERLRELHIGAGLTTGPTANAILRSPVFKQLIVFSCRAERNGGITLVNDLHRLEDPPRLKALDLSGTRVPGLYLRRLLISRVISSLEVLDLSDNNHGVDDTQILAAADLPHLRSLRLLRTRPEEEGVRALAEARFLPGLRSLALGGNNLPPSAAAILAGASQTAGLRVLDLRENRLGNVGAASLANSPHLRNLIHLDLAANGIADAGADALAESPHLGGLIFLDLDGNNISSEAVTRLVRRFGSSVSV